MANKEKHEMNGQENYRSHCWAKLMKEVEGPFLLDVISIHIIKIPFLDNFCSQNKINHEINRDPKDIESDRDIEKFNHIKFKVDCQKSSLFFRNLCFIRHGVPSEIP